MDPDPSGAFDAVIDFDTVVADPRDRTRLAPRYDSGDHLHPSDAGYDAMGRAAARVVRRAARRTGATGPDARAAPTATVRRIGGSPVSSRQLTQATELHGKLSVPPWRSRPSGHVTTTRHMPREAVVHIALTSFAPPLC